MIFSMTLQNYQFGRYTDALLVYLCQGVIWLFKMKGW